MRETVMLQALTPQFSVDTASSSLIHRLAQRKVAKPPHLAVIYLIVVAITYVLLLLTVVLTGVPLWTTTAAGPLPFMRDFGLTYALLVSLPTLVVLLVSDDDLLNGAIQEVMRDDVIAIPEIAAVTLKTKWEGRCRLWNQISQGVAI